LIAEADFGPRANASRLPGVGWLVTRKTGALVVIDETLATIARFGRSSTWRASHWATPDLERAVLSERDRVVLIDRDGRTVWQVHHDPWGNSGSESGSCWVSPDGRVVWATVPSADGADEWWVLDAADGNILGVAALQCCAAGSEPIPHPKGKHIGLSVGEGQDGCEVYWGHWDGRVHVSRLDARDRVLCAVRPDGTAYLATPHGGGALTVHSFPTGDVRARLSDSDVFGDDDRFEFQAGYVTNDIVLVGSTEEERHLLLRADTLEVVAEIEYPEGATRGGISPTGSGAWLTCDYLSGRFQLWRGRWS
jgi:hypothetical protein